jgi:uncharacterized membrane protein YuzA (DUF378 family)
VRVYGAARYMQPASDMETTSSTRTAGIVALVLAIIGSLNWLLVGLFKFNVISALFGNMSTLSRIIYVLVGLAGLYLIAAARSFFPHMPEAGLPSVTGRRHPVT